MTRPASAALPRLMLVTDRRRCRARTTLEAQTRRAVAGGVRLVQFREREATREQQAIRFARLAADSPEVTWLVNDVPELSRRWNCGLHLPAASPTHKTGSRPRPFGRSVHDERELRLALEDDVDYLIVGTIYATDSKPGLIGCGPEWIARARALAKNVPLYAIGGITLERVPEVLQAGAHGIAVCGALLAARDPTLAARRLTEALGESPL